MRFSKVRSFRRVLREFERALNQALEENNCCCGLTLAQCHPLLEIDMRGRTTIGQLAQSLRLDKSTLSRTVDGLVSKGLVSRTPNPDDRRSTLLTLTNQGKRICAAINDKNDAHYQSVFRRIPSKEHDKVMEYFGLLVKAMNSADPATGGDDE